MKRTILIAEDDPDLSHLLELHLRSRGYVARCVRSIREAESSLSETRPAMILLDNNLPDGLAIQSLDKFRSHAADIPIVLMTADFLHDVRGHEQYGAIDAILLKPFTSDRLNHILDQIPS